MVYRVGDEVEFKKHGGRRRRAKWVPAEVDKLHRGGMYGELTYNVWLLDSERMEEYVCAEELRFRYPEDLEKRQRDDEIARCREDLQQIKLKLIRQQRGFSRGRRDERQGAWTQRSCSVGGNVNLARPARQQPRSASVPPAHWVDYVAEHARNNFSAPRGVDQRLAPAGDSDYVYNDNRFRERDHENERDERGLRGNMDYKTIVNDVNHGGDRVADWVRPAPQNRDNPVIENRRKAKTDRIDMVGKRFNLNLYICGDESK